MSRAADPAPTPLARAAYLATVVFGAGAVIAYATEPNRSWWSWVTAGTIGLFVVFALTETARRGPAVEAERSARVAEGSALTFAGLALFNLGNALGHHGDSWWASLLTFVGMAVAFTGMARSRRAR